MLKEKRLKDTIELNLKTILEVGERWNKRSEIRKKPSDLSLVKPEEQVKIIERYRNINEREITRSIIQPVSVDIRSIGFERKIGDTLDMSKRPPNSLAESRGKPVGRIYQKPDPGLEIDAFGTGFLISNNLLITNYHVFPTKEHAEGCMINFLYEINSYSKPQTGIHFNLDPTIFFLNDSDLDYAIIYVATLNSEENELIKSLDYIKMISTPGKIVIGDPLNIIQHPDGGLKEYAITNNIVKDILETEGFIHYTTDTLRSSSGSPAFNKYWELSALHHRGVPQIVNKQVWSTHNSPWDPNSMTDDEVLWIANEGISISFIINKLKQVKLNNSKEQDILDKLILSTRDDLLTKPRTLESTPQIITPKTNNMSSNVFNFNGPNTIYINTSNISNLESGNIKSELQPPVQFLEAKLRFDENYKNRRYKGYKENFLSVNIPLPKTGDSRKNEIAETINNGGSTILKYYHYSLEVNKKYRMQMWSAVNVDYDPTHKSSRNRDEFGDEGNSWRYDPRLNEKYQINNDEFYKPATKVDRGHVVRRDDSCYGNTELEIEYANSDTFHWTNCTPQHEAFNQSRRNGLWGNLEESIKEQLNSNSEKASIFAGPVLVNTSMREYNDIKYPLKFWKVMAIVDDNDGLIAYGFILDQSDVVNKFGLEAKFDFTDFEFQQNSLVEIEQKTGIEFPKILHDADIFNRNGLNPNESRKIKDVNDLIIKSTKPGKKK